MRRLVLLLCLVCLWPTFAWGQVRMSSGSLNSGSVATTANTNGLTVEQDCSGLPFLTALSFSQGLASVLLEVATAPGTNGNWFPNTTIALSSATPRNVTHVTNAMPYVRLRSASTAVNLAFVLSCKP